jgi:hypothetical protein
MIAPFSPAVFSIFGGGRFIGTIEKTIPEAAMNENAALIAWENDIGRAGKLFHVQSETKSSCVEVVVVCAQQDFGAGIVAPDDLHHRRTVFCINNIHAFASW